MAMYDNYEDVEYEEVYDNHPQVYDTRNQHLQVDDGDDIGPDTILIESSPSQWTNIGWLALTVAGFLLFPPIGIAIGVVLSYKVLHTGSISYELTPYTLTEKSGFFSVSTRVIPLYRIKSTKLVEPFLYQLVGLSTLYLETSDKYGGEMKLYAIGGGEHLQGSIVELVEIIREEKGMTEFDIYQN
jgi:membrane protein YdbS with pleckstrin-like domain